MELPPIDKSGETTKASTLLKRTRRHMEEFTPDWQKWIVESLLAGLPYGKRGDDDE